MSPQKRKKQINYPYEKRRVYFSTVTAVLSIALALLLLQISILFLYYCVSTLLMTVITYVLKSRLLSTITSEPAELATTTGGAKWKTLILMFCVILAFLLLPLLLAKILHPTIWFIGIVSFTSGVSISEILLYVHIKETWY